MRDARSVEEFPQSAIMLHREHFGRRQKKRLPARVGGGGDGDGGDDGLARAHVAQKHAVHRMRLGHLAQNLQPRALLLVGEREGQRSVERLHARATDLVLRGHLPAAACGALLHKVQLQHEHFLVRQATTRLARLSHAFGKVNSTEGCLATHQAILRAKLKRHRVEDARRKLERVAHEPAHKRRRHLLARGVHGNDQA